MPASQVAPQDLAETTEPNEPIARIETTYEFPSNSPTQLSLQEPYSLLTCL